MIVCDFPSSYWLQVEYIRIDKRCHIKNTAKLHLRFTTAKIIHHKNTAIATTAATTFTIAIASASILGGYWVRGHEGWWRERAREKELEGGMRERDREN